MATGYTKKMETWSSRLRAWMRDAGLNVPELSRRSGVPEASLYKYLKGRTDAPRGKILSDIADVFGKTAVELRYGARVATSGGVRNIPLLSMNEIRTFASSANAWGGRVVEVSSADLSDAAFAVEVTDAACSPKIEPGDMVIVEPARTVEPGGYVVAYVDRLQTGVVRKYRPRHALDKTEFHLIATNDDFPAIHVSEANPGRIIGRAVKVIKNL